jgi:hypothetical protein
MVMMILRKVGVTRAILVKREAATVNSGDFIDHQLVRVDSTSASKPVEESSL